MSTFDESYRKALEAARTPAGQSYAKRLSKIPSLGGVHEVEWRVREFEKGVEEPRIPNLDEMSEDALMAFWNKYRFGSKKNIAELFPGWPVKGMRAVLAGLANYAANRATVKASNRRGDKQAADIYEHSCRLVYDRLPKFAKFKG